MENENFPKSGGDALEIGDEDFDDSEDADDMPAASSDAMRQPMKANIAASAQATAGKPAEVKG